MDTESVRSGYSERSRRPANRVHHGVIHSESANIIQSSNSSPYNDLGNSNRLNFINNHHQNRSLSGHHGQRSNRDTIHSNLPAKISGKLNGHDVHRLASGNPPSSMDYRRSEEVIVQILHQDDRWADNTTAITGNTSEHSLSIDVDLNKIGKNRPWNDHHIIRYKCDLWCGPLLAGILSLGAFLSPIIMLILPRIESLDWKVKECGPECDGPLIGVAFQLIILLLCSWALFIRSPRATLPQIHIYRAIIMALLFFLIITYWIFYGERIYDKRFSDYDLTYESVVKFTTPFVNILFWIYLTAVILIHIRHQEPIYQAKVLRSPDGECFSYNIGHLDIQRAAVYILEKYYQDFSIYNPYLEVLPTTSRSRSKHAARAADQASGNHLTSNTSTIKYYDVDSANPTGLSSGLITSPLTAPNHNSSTSRLVNESSLADLDENTNMDDRTSRRGRSASHHHHHRHHNDRFYEEHEYERRVQKRRARLLAATEEAFTHIRRIRAEGPCPLSSPIDHREAAQAIFPAIARPLQKYLRVTRQQPRYSVESIIDHLSQCLTFDLSPKAFLEKYFNTRPVLQNDREKKISQGWGLVSDVPLTRNIESGSVFMLRQDDVSLLVTIHSLPHFHLNEEIIDPKSNKFVFKMNSETSV